MAEDAVDDTVDDAVRDAVPPRTQDAPGAVRVLKFGGTSLAGIERIRSVAEIVAGRRFEGPLVVVVSAAGGVTPGLLDAADRAAAGDPAWEERLRALEARHRELAGVAGGGEAPSVRDDMVPLVGDLEDLLHGVSLLRECTPRTRDLIASFGERLSALVVAAALRAEDVPARAVDAREGVVTDDGFGDARVDVDATRGRLRRLLRDGPGDDVPVVTGFVGATPDGETTTLGRGGSDHTAALVGAALEAAAVEIWTDVDGVMSADPRLVPDASSLPALTYDELLELSHFGATVIHPPAVRPVREAGIPLVIRNTLNPGFPGTRVARDAPPGRGHPVRAISSIREISLLRLEGGGMVGVPGIAARLFGALADEGISVILISQASSEHSISVAIEPRRVDDARRAVDAEFELERAVGRVDPLVVEDGLSVIAPVGEGMRETPGLAGRVFDVLGDRGINVHAIAQGSSELNISLVVSRDEEEDGLRAVHDAFFRVGGPEVRLYLAGPGRVGSTLLAQIAGRREALARERGIELVVAGIADSGRAALDPGGIDPAAWEGALEGADADAGALVEAARSGGPGPRIVVDATASPELPEAYPGLLDAGVEVVTANKHGPSGPRALHRAIRREGGGPGGPRPRRGTLHAGTTVGAGLPILRTVDELVATGDRIVEVEGVLSGTLSYLFRRLSEGAALSEAVREAHERGYTEPDPRADLRGDDVVRKLVIIAREAGRSLGVDDVAVEPVLGGSRWDALDPDGFWDALPAADEAFAGRVEEAAAEGACLVYLARLDDDGATVGVAAVPGDHPCADLSGTDNVVALTTRRYDETPLVIRGPGAGPAVTAAGLFADVLRAAGRAVPGTGGGRAP